MRVITRKTESLECHLTSDEFSARSSALASACQDVSQEESRQQQIKADMKAQLAKAEAERSRLTLIVARKAEFRDVPVRIEADDAKAEAITIREDTGEIVRRRALELHERQPMLPGTDDPDTSETACAHGVDIADDCPACEAENAAMVREAVAAAEATPPTSTRAKSTRAQA